MIFGHLGGETEVCGLCNIFLLENYEIEDFHKKGYDDRNITTVRTPHDELFKDIRTKATK